MSGGIERILLAVRQEHASDQRTAVFDVELFEDGPSLVVTGVTSEPAALEALNRRLGTYAGDLPIRVDVRLLPLPDAERPHAVCGAAVAPMTSGPTASDVVVSQALLGHRMMVLREHGRWVQCRASYGYLGWIHRGYLVRLTEAEARNWDAGEGGSRSVSLGARALANDGSVVLPLPWGSRLVGLPDGEVRLPDGRRLRVEGEVLTEEERAGRFPPRGEAVVATALDWMGAPYVWGGLTRLGVDCSGLVQLVFRMHGLELPRDSDQQAEAGVAVEAGAELDGLLPGDLVFFAEESTRISHVAISLGGSRIVHASIGSGGVTIDDLAGESSRELELRRLMAGTRRLLGDSSTL